jgi:hypothetical protein
MPPSPDTAALVGEARKLLATWQQMLDSGVVFIEDLAAEFPAAPTLIAQLCDALEAAEAEVAELRAALKRLVESVVTTMAVFDDGEEEEMLIVPPGALESAATTLREGAPDAD